MKRVSVAVAAIVIAAGAAVPGAVADSYCPPGSESKDYCEPPPHHHHHHHHPNQKRNSTGGERPG